MIKIMRSFSWLLILLVLFRLGWGTAMAMPAHTAAPGEHPVMAASACHEHTAPAAAGDPTPQSPATALWSSLDDCHHCCAVGLASPAPTLWPPTPETPSNSAIERWNSVSVRPDLRPPIA